MGRAGMGCSTPFLPCCPSSFQQEDTYNTHEGHIKKSRQLRTSGPKICQLQRFLAATAQQKNAVNYTILTIIERDAHMPISQRKQSFSWHWILGEFLTVYKTQVYLHRTGLGCYQWDFWETELIVVGYFSFQSQAPVLTPGHSPVMLLPRLRQTIKDLHHPPALQNLLRTF